MSSIPDLTDAAGFVFEGIVQKLQASNVSEFPASEKTALVRVTKLIHAPDSLKAYANQEVTVALQASDSVKAGQTAIFFTHGAFYGDNLVVAEIGNAQSGAETEGLVSNAAQSTSDSQLMQRLAQSRIVVTGQASAPSPPAIAALAATAAPISEHDPDWQTVTVNVESTQKGDQPGSTVNVLFANSNDIAWHSSPKFSGGEHGVWILQDHDQFGRPTPGLAVVHPLDFQPTEQLPKVQSLLALPPK